MNNETNIDVQYISPLKKICMTIGELPSSYLETMSYYEMLVWFTEFLKNQVIPAVNNNAEAVQELQSLYEELRTYVNDYFENLNVQEEIDNKLDEMYRDGTLDNLFARYVNPVLDIQNERINQQDILLNSQQTSLNNLTTRMNSFTELTEGSTTGDAELIDGRISRTGLVYPNIGENIRQSTQNNFNEFNTYSVRTKSINLFDKNDCLKGYAINFNNGTLTANADYYATNFIKIDGESVHRITYGNMAWYDENKDFISGVNYTGANTQSKPEGAVYMRTSFYKTTANGDLNAWWIGDSQDVPKYTPYYKYQLLEDKLHNQTASTLEDNIELQANYSFKDASGYVTRTRTNNLLDKNACLINRGIGDNGQAIVTNGWYVSPYIQITQSTVYRSHAGNMAWYDENKKFIAYVNYDGTTAQSKPSGAVYMRTSINANVIDSATVGDGVSVPSSTPYYNYLIIDNLNKNTSKIFKKVVCIGDSYTSGYIVDSSNVSHDMYDYSWPSYMEKITGNEYVNCSLGGRNVLTWQTSNNCYTKAVASGKAQAYIIGLGLNDSSVGANHVDVGTIADVGTEAQTYYGGMSQIINKMLAISPDAKIFIQTIPNTGAQYTDYNTAIRNIVTYYNTTLNNPNVFLLDLYEYRSMYQTSSITGDAWHGHYTAIGYEQFAENLNVILSLYINSHIENFRDVAFIDYD